MSKTMSCRQVSHVLAALRYCQDHVDLGDMEHFTMPSGRVIPALDDTGINALCEDINCGDIDYVEAADGSE
jgi:hypothetical protein